MPVSVGQLVPDFSAPATGGEFQLSKHRGQALVIYFYPKDNTPGCTTEGEGFSAAHPQFAQAGTGVFGLSRDSLKSHEGFKAKLGMPFDLISDADESVCALFDVIKMKNMYGKQVRGIERSTFLIGPEGHLVREWRGVKVPGHVDEVLAAAQALGLNAARAG
jgi:peroxiredoxin Q/BCP